ncbi:MAG: hypothetical protein ABSB35_42620, partial [Bryobacteraceae bacterium]
GGSRTWALDRRVAGSTILLAVDTPMPKHCATSMELSNATTWGPNFRVADHLPGNPVASALGALFGK